MTITVSILIPLNQIKKSENSKNKEVGEAIYSQLLAWVFVGPSMCKYNYSVQYTDTYTQKKGRFQNLQKNGRIKKTSYLLLFKLIILFHNYICLFWQNRKGWRHNVCTKAHDSIAYMPYQLPSKTKKQNKFCNVIQSYKYNSVLLFTKTY